MKASTVICVGDIIRWRRKKKGWTQKKLAEESGIHEVQIRRYESNKSLPRDAQLSKIAEALGLEKDYFEDIPQRTAEMNAAVLTTPDGKPVTGPFTTPFQNPSPREHVKTPEYLFSLNPKLDINNIIKKINNKRPVTVYELEFLYDEALLKLGTTLKQFYSQLNFAGKEKANEHIDQLIDQLELLTKIPEYQKEPETKTNAPKCESQDGEKI